MKILIVSDVHGRNQNLEKVLQDHPSFDYLFLLGDIISSNSSNNRFLAELLNPFAQKIICVRGNNDYYDFDLFDFHIDQDYALVPVEHKLFFLTHGHLYQPYNTSQFEYDVFLSGHTHTPLMKKEKDIYYLNPGSLSLPRGDLGGTYLVYQDGNFQLRGLDNRIIKEL